MPGKALCPYCSLTPGRAEMTDMRETVQTRGEEDAAKLSSFGMKIQP